MYLQPITGFGYRTCGWQALTNFCFSTMDYDVGLQWQTQTQMCKDNNNTGTHQGCRSPGMPRFGGLRFGCQDLDF